MAAEGRTFYFLLVAFVTVALLMAPATAFGVALLCKRMIEAGIPAAQAAASALLCGLGTPLIFRTGHLNHNLLVGDAGLIALLLLWDPADRPLQSHASRFSGAAGRLRGSVRLQRRCDRRRLPPSMSGLRSGGDSPARWQCVAAYLAGLVPGIAGLFLYQQWAFGSFYRPSQQYMTPTAPTAHGYRGFTWPSPALLWANFFDPRFGLFPYCPALLLASWRPLPNKPAQRLPSREMRLISSTASLFIVVLRRQPVLLAATLHRLPLPRADRPGTGPGRHPGHTASAADPSMGNRHRLADVEPDRSWRPSERRRLAAADLVDRRFALPWMIRLRAAGVPVSWEWVLATYLITALAIVTIWAGPVLRRRRGGRVGELP
jgi:hypothetical protein